MSMKKFIKIVNYMLATGLLFSSMAISAVASTKHALLVGISDYHVKPLAGPVNDVYAIRQVLLKHWGFELKNVTLLLNQQATKNNILEKMRSLFYHSKPGDEIFIYLSGHGTSASDHGLATALPTTTGAFIPIDIKDIDNAAELVDRLIVGKNDIRPILTRLDEGNRHVFVAIDACYSGNTVRGVFNEKQLPSRFLDINDLLPTRGFGDDINRMRTTDWKEVSEDKSNTYPYKNIFYLSASGEHEPAQDIPPNMLAQYPTFDAKPHGAFTDSLLRILNKNLDADMDNNGSLSYAELKKTLRTVMRKRGFNHTPQGLPSLAEDSNNITERYIFGTTRDLSATSASERIVSNTPKKPVSIKISQPVPSDKLSVRIDKSVGFLKKDLQKMNSVILVDHREDIFLTRDNRNILLLSSGGDLINTIVEGSKKTLIKILHHQSWIKTRLEQSYVQDFVVELELYGNGLGSTAVEGQLIGFSIKASQDAYLLLIDIDPNGQVSVIYPLHAAEMKYFEKLKPISLRNISRVRAPFGRDIVQVYAFNEINNDYKLLAGKQFFMNTPEMKAFERLINNPQLKTARATLELITTPKM